MMDEINSLLKPLNGFMNDKDRGIGHGLSHGIFYGFMLMPLCGLPWWVMALALIGNHARVIYQEWEVEQWVQKEGGAWYHGDFWYDIYMRPLQTDVVACMGFASIGYWWIFVIAAVIIGIKKKNDWPLLMFWM